MNNWLRLTAGVWSCLLCSAALYGQQESIVELKDGTRLGPGVLLSIPTISTNSMARGQTETSSLSIKQLDDELRKTYFNQARLSTVNPSVLKPEEIVMPLATEAQGGASAFAIRQVLRVEPFNKYGRRLYTIMGGTGPESLLQGITHLTPTYARVQTLRDQGAKRTWDQRIGTTTIPAATLRTILHHELNMDSPEDRMRIYRFYLQGERYVEARQELLDALAAFPEQLAEQRNLLFNLNQAVVAKMFREVEIRRRSGQPKLVAQLLDAYIKDGEAEDSLEARESVLKAQGQYDALKAKIAELAELVGRIKADLAALPAADQELVRPVITELEQEISIESEGRLADYKFQAKPNQSPDKRISLAVGGWLMGGGGGIDNFEIAKSAIRVNGLVREYLTVADAARREVILEQLNKEEAGRPELVGRVLGAMKPLLPLPEAAPEDPPGLLRVDLPESETTGKVQYTIQLPPEYDPRRRYPCIVALPGLGGPKDMEIGWWCGGYNQKTKERFGVATRYGYIVIVPQWYEEGQLTYNYSGAEHDRVLRSVRDAFRRLNIDTNRVFISGHFDGGAAAWDIALSHPDLWAGAVLLSPLSEKFILMYGDNAAYVPTYTVWGSCDGSSFNANLGRTIDNYLKKSKFDALGVCYNGRPRDHFLEEVPRIMDWMEMSSHRRNPSPDEINVEAARAGDRFFYWFEMKEIDPDRVISPAMFEAKRESRVEVKLQPAGRSILLSKYPAREVIVWLRPGFVSFSQSITVQNKTSNKKITHVFQGDNRVLLEDVRTRADRVEPFYDRIDIGR